jgi:hypothetical protein
MFRSKKKECEICLTNKSKKYFDFKCRICSHEMCKKCTFKIENINNVCPFCRTKLPSKELINQYNLKVVYQCLSEKIDILELERIVRNAKRNRKNSEISKIAYVSLNEILRVKKIQN